MPIPISYFPLMPQGSTSMYHPALPHDFSSSFSSSSETSFEEALRRQQHSSGSEEHSPLSQHTVERPPSLTIYIEPASKFRRSLDFLMQPSGLKRRAHVRRKVPPLTMKLALPVDVTNSYEYSESPILSPSSTICTYTPSEHTYSYNPPFSAPTETRPPGRSHRPPSYIQNRSPPGPAFSNNIHSSAPVPLYTTERTDHLLPYWYDRPLPNPPLPYNSPSSASAQGHDRPLPSPPLSYDSPVFMSAQGHAPDPFEVESSEDFHPLPNPSGLSNPPSPSSTEEQEAYEQQGMRFFESHLPPSSSRQSSFYLSQMTYVQRINSLLQYGTPKYKPQSPPPIQTQCQESQDTPGSHSIYGTMVAPQFSPFYADTVGDIEPDELHTPPPDQTRLPERSDSMSIYSVTTASETGHWDTIGDVKPDDSVPAGYSWGWDTEVFTPENIIVHEPSSWLRPEYEEEERRFSFARQDTAVIVNLLRERRRRAGMDSILVTDSDGPFIVDDYRQD